MRKEYYNGNHILKNITENRMNEKNSIGNYNYIGNPLKWSILLWLIVDVLTFHIPLAQTLSQLKRKSLEECK